MGETRDCGVPQEKVGKKQKIKEEKERLDVLLVKRGLAESREKAKAVIMAGDVFVNGVREDKAGSTFPVSAQIERRGVPMKYVSRGGFKLEKAVMVHGVKLDGKVCMDVGSSTGGFTDCMLQNGAVKVFAIDVGTNQLAWKLRQDARVVVMEQTNIRYVTPQDIGEAMDFVSIDVAFISLTLVLAPVSRLMKEGAELVCLIKPQFEAGREKVGKKGVVREAEVHREVIKKVVDYAAGVGFELLHLDYSPIKGPEGNIEYLLHARKNAACVGKVEREEADEEMADGMPAVICPHEELTEHRVNGVPSESIFHGENLGQCVDGMLLGFSSQGENSEQCTDKMPSEFCPHGETLEQRTDVMEIYRLIAPTVAAAHESLSV